MAGTIFGLGLSQRVDSNGKPAQAWLLYLYDQNSSTPVNSYQDTALTVLNPWPIEADANGTMGQFWLADGSYRARATNSDGSIIYFDLQSVLALGPSTGSAPSGGVDPNAIFSTGDVMWQEFQGTRSGWVRDNGRTIGSATSGAAERANADCQALFLYLWTNFSDAICPVLTGRGGSAAADWASNKKITLPDKRGYLVGGLDDMGNSAASRWTGAPVIAGSVTTAGSTIGETTHTLTTAELAAHNHTINITDPGHVHAVQIKTIGGGASPLAALTGSAGGLNTDVHTTGITADSVNAGSGSAHNIVQRTVLGTFYRKL